MSGYVPDPNDATQPTDPIIAQTAAAEFRALKGKVNGISAGAVLGTGGRNIVVNGDMEFDQINNYVIVVSIASGAYICDGWYITVSQPAKFNTQCNNTRVAPALGYPNQLTAVVATQYSPGVADNFIFRQPIEGNFIRHLDYGLASARTTTLLFWAKSTVIGLHSGSVRNGVTNNRSFVFTFNLPAANTWTQFAIQIPGDTTGTWNIDNTRSVDIVFNLGSGTNAQTGLLNQWQAGSFNGAAGAIILVNQPVANNLQITGVEWKDGIYAVGSPPEIIPYVERRAKVQRYYKPITCVVATAPAFTNISFGITMVKIPVITGGGAGFNSAGIVNTENAACQQTAAAQQALIFDARL